LYNNDYARPYFQNTNPNIRLVHQACVLFNYNGIECKGALDGIKIDYKNKIISPFDLKTTGKSVRVFPQSFLSFGYYLQGAFYVEGLKRVLKENPEEFLNMYNLPKEVSDYTVENMRFIVVEKNTSVATMPAYIFKTTDELHDLGINGGMINGKIYRGFIYYLEDRKYHTSSNYWEYSRDYIDNKGEFDINPFTHEFI
jgi:hypothetical protein